MKLSEYIIDNLDCIFISSYHNAKRIWLNNGYFIDTKNDMFMKQMSSNKIKDKSLVNKNFLDRIDEIYIKEMTIMPEYVNYETLLKKFGYFTISLKRGKPGNIEFENEYTIVYGSITALVKRNIKTMQIDIFIDKQKNESRFLQATRIHKAHYRKGRITVDRDNMYSRN